MPKQYISTKNKKKLKQLSNGRCEYCLYLEKYSPSPFCIEHIIPLSSNGSSQLNNLANACGGCNGHKYNKVLAFDSITGVDVPLFHPRQQSWSDHFEWDEDYLNIIGKTATGRVTVKLLHLN